MFKDQCLEWMRDVLPDDVSAGLLGAEDGAHRAFAVARTQMYVQDADQVGTPLLLRICFRGFQCDFLA